jgi:hypothetical protein
VQFIDTLKIPRDDQMKNLRRIEPPDYNALLTLLDRVPSHLITLQGSDFNQLVRCQSEIENMLRAWAVDDDHTHHRRQFTCASELTHPVLTIGRLMKLCPDDATSSPASYFTFITDKDLRENLSVDMNAIDLALTNSEWKAATVLAGALSEALLLWRLSQDSLPDLKSAVAASSLTKKPDPSKLEWWTLHEYIEVAAVRKIFRDETIEQLRLSKDFRNLIHPGRSQRTGMICNRATALSASAGVLHVSEDLE